MKPVRTLRQAYANLYNLWQYAQDTRGDDGFEGKEEKELMARAEAALDYLAKFTADTEEA